MARSISIFFACVISFSAAQNVTNGRLPETVRPTSYVVTINTDMDNFNFTGSVSITLVATEPTRNLTIHMKDLTPTGIRLEGGVDIEGAMNSHEADTVVWFLDNDLVVGQNYVLTVNYTGVLGTENVGFYRASYLDESNNTRHLAVTQFAPTNARRAFPCFDQPDMKATFRIILIRDRKYFTTSNMYQQISEEYPLDPTKMVDTYAITPAMSTYLVAFTVSDYSIVYEGTYSIYGRKELLDKGEGNYALTVGRAAIFEMAVYTSVNYDLFKVEQFAIPNDYHEFDALGNWGMITYRERNLMYNQINSTAAEKQNVMTIIAHECAHQWFGNLVTPQWWNWIWLSEGFATYLGMIVADQLEPNWKIMDQFITSVMQPAFNVDALLSTTPMTKDAETSSQILTLFDNIAYEKAGSVIRMMASFLGEPAFQAGLTAYLREWRWRNVEPSNLYSSWQTALNKSAVNVSLIMTSWETQSGFPVVTVTRNYSVDTINLSQARFLLNTNVTDDTTKWLIPINWFSPTVPVNAYRILNEDVDVNSSVPAEDWLVANFNREGYYRVNYDEDNWKLIVDALVQNPTQIPVRNRAQLVDDSFNLARAGLIDYSIAFDLGKYFVSEEEYVPIAAFTHTLSYLHRITAGTIYNTYITNYGLEILERIYAKTGFDISPQDTHLQKLLKVNLMTSMCNLGHEECRVKSLETFQTWLTDGIEVQPDAQSFVYCNALTNSTEAPVNWAVLVNVYFTSRDVNQRSRIAAALGCIDRDAFWEVSLNFIMSEELGFSATDRLGLIVSIYSNNQERGVRIVLDSLTRRYVALSARLSSMSRIVSDLADRITTRDLLMKFYDFAEVNEQYFSESLKVTVARAVATAQYNLEWLETVSPQFESYFATTPPTTPDGGGGGASITGQTFTVVIYLIAVLLY